MIVTAVKKLLPCFDWFQGYNKTLFSADLIAGIVTTIMLVPQSLSYALLAGLPPQVGLYASLLPLLIYCLFGASGPLSVGPFAITSIMTASAVGAIATSIDPSQHLLVAMLLAWLVGFFLLACGLLRLGFLSNFICFPAMVGFISASACIIAMSQIKHFLNIPLPDLPLLQTLYYIAGHVAEAHQLPLIVGLCSALALYFLPAQIKKIVVALGGSQFISDLAGKGTPIVVFTTAIIVTKLFGLDQQGLAVVGAIPQDFPAFSLPDMASIMSLKDHSSSILHSAFLIAIIGYVTSLSAAQAFAVKMKTRIEPNREAVAIGLANLASASSGAFPVAASLSRSAVCFKAGARTPATSAITAVGVALSCIFLTPYLYYLPIVTLAGMVVVAVFGLFDVAAMKRIIQYSKKDTSILVLTFSLTLLQGLEWGFVSGIVLSVALHLYRSSRPHVAVLGLVENTEHFRNIERHDVVVDDKVIMLRVDSSLYFANSSFLFDLVNKHISANAQAKHVVLNCSPINYIDITALESLFEINRELQSAGVLLHLSEIKGPVADYLYRSDFLNQLSGKVYLSHFQAWQDLTDEQ